MSNCVIINEGFGRTRTENVSLTSKNVDVFGNMSKSYVLDHNVNLLQSILPGEGFFNIISSSDDSRLGGGFSEGYVVGRRTDFSEMQKVFLKVLKKTLSHDRAAHDVFRNEFDILCFLQEKGVKNIVEPVFLSSADVFSGRVLALGLGYIDKPLFSKVIDSIHLNHSGKNPEEFESDRNFCLDYLVGVAETLQSVHDLGIIHLDVKPNNLFFGMDSSGVPEHVLFDFGISRVCRYDRLDVALDNSNSTNSLDDSISVKGTPNYIAPEVCVASQYSKSADIYSFACMLYKTLIGDVPYGSSDSINTLFFKKLGGRIGPLKHELKKHKIPGKMRKVVLRSLNCKLEKRHPSMKAFAEELYDAIPYMRWSLTAGVRKLFNYE